MSKKKKKLIRITTIAGALAFPLKGQPSFMHENGYDVIMISAAGWSIDKVIQQETCPHLAVELSRKITPIQDLRALIKLIKIFRDQNPDIVHTETPKAGLLGMLAARICNVKVRIHTVAGLPLMVEKGFKLWLLKWIEKITYAAATNVWPNGPSLYSYILGNKFTNPRKLKLIGKGSSNGIDIKEFTPENLDSALIEKIKSEISYNSKNIYLLFVGRIVLDKGIVELVDAFLSLQIEYPNLKLIAAGFYERELDPLPAATEDQIKGNPSIFHIEWTNDTAAYMAISDLFVFPTYREGFPNVLLEAGAMKLPIVCSDIPGNVDIVNNNYTGITFEAMNTEALRKAILLALQDTEKGKEMSEVLQKEVRKNYPRNVFWNEMLREYNYLTTN